MHFKQDSFDLTVIFEKSCSLQRIKQDLAANVIQIAAALVRRVKLSVKRNLSF